jgi:hypothetical protein
MSGSPGERSVVIDDHICGLPGVGFGGYVAGLLATELGGPAEVDFIHPAPLGTELSIERDLTSEVMLLDGANLLAVGRPHEISDDHPAPPTWDAAVLASEAYLAMTDHDYPNCFGCGSSVPDGKGMRVFTGPIKGHELVAAAWSPSDSFAADNGELLPKYVWSALDCPGGRARAYFISSEPAVTAYLTVQQKAPILAGTPYLVAGWPVRQDGRKSFVGMAIFDRDGDLCASGEALWISVTA